MKIGIFEWDAEEAYDKKYLTYDKNGKLLENVPKMSKIDIINEFLEDKKVIDMKYQIISGNYRNRSLLVMYEENDEIDEKENKK